MKKEIESVIRNDDTFKITFYPQNMNADVEDHQVQSTTRLASWNDDCDFVFKPKTKNVSPFVKFYDVENKGYRIATTKYRAVSISLDNNHYTWTGK